MSGISLQVLGIGDDLIKIFLRKKVPILIFFPHLEKRERISGVIFQEERKKKREDNSSFFRGEKGLVFIIQSEIISRRERVAGKKRVRLSFLPSLAKGYAKCISLLSLLEAE